MSDSPAGDATAAVSFRDLALGDALQRVLSEVGYEAPSPIQAATIPHLLAGRDVLGQAQTGTGKTAAFALPILARLKTDALKPQALVLAPTRELAIQVAEAFQRYAAHLPGFHVLPIYGGQSYGPQLAGLKRGAHVIVGTPGRVIDHLERGSLDLSQLTTLVLDEADEMLRMGFIDDVETILAKTPPQRQVALFSATMPAPIRRIAQTHLREPAEVTIKTRTTTAANIRQRYWWVSGMHKLDALTRILEVETFDAMIVFARTKQATEELAERLQARGLAAAAINGDMQQQQRERTIQQLKDGKLDILVATDVAARGLDVERISHVLNYDIPHDTESYVHRIGRTGRAGRSGEAIVFVTPREKRLLQAIERATRQPIEEMQLPTVQTVNDKRMDRFLQKITDTLAAGELGVFQSLVERYQQEKNVPAIEIAAALARIVQGDKPLLLEPPARVERKPFAPGAGSERERSERPERRERREPGARPERAAPRYERASHDRAPHDRAPHDRAPHDRAPHERTPRERAPRDTSAFTPAAAGEGFAGAAADDTRAERPRRPAAARAPEPGMETFRVEVGHVHGVKPGNLVGAIANEAGLESKYIGRIAIEHDHSLVDLPEGMPSELLSHLKKVWVSGQRLRISRVKGGTDEGGRPPRRPGAAPKRSGPPKRPRSDG